LSCGPPFSVAAVVLIDLHAVELDFELHMNLQFSEGIWPSSLKEGKKNKAKIHHHYQQNQTAGKNYK
jgi:hypothetical protein